MTTARRSAFVIATIVLLAVTALPAAAGAATADPQLELGLPSPAFVEALHDPVVTLGLGRLPSPVEVSVGAGMKARAASADLPLRVQPRRSRPGHRAGQGPGLSYGTCWAFANIAALESKILISQGQHLGPERGQPRRAQRLSGRRWPALRKSGTGGATTSWPSPTSPAGPGPVTEANDPYPSMRLPAVNHVVKHVQGVVMIPGRSADLDNDLIKQLVMANGALSVGMWWDPDTYDAATSSYFLADPEKWENHGVCIVGWDDDVRRRELRRRRGGAGTATAPSSRATAGARASATTATSGCRTTTSRSPATRVRHLRRGHLVLGRGRRRQLLAQLRLRQARASPTALGYPDGSPIWAANRFTAASYRSIAAVGFYTLSSGTPYEVWAGRTLKTLTRRASGTATLPGYATVKLDKPAAGGQGRHVRGRHQAGVARRKPPAGRRDGAPTRPTDSSPRRRPAAGRASWGPMRWRMSDLTSVIPAANVCLKAFAR